MCLKRSFTSSKTQTQEKRGKFNIGRPIPKRLKSIRNRQAFGHWRFLHVERVKFV